MKTYYKHSIQAVILSMVLLGTSNNSPAGGYYKKIGYSDLNLEQPADVGVLYERIKSAAQVICTDSTAIWGYHRKSYNRCFKKTVDKAVKSIDNSVLTKLHQGQEQAVTKR